MPKAFKPSVHAMSLGLGSAYHGAHIHKPALYDRMYAWVEGTAGTPLAMCALPTGVFYRTYLLTCIFINIT
jgi:hypothetical protein